METDRTEEGRDAAWSAWLAAPALAAALVLAAAFLAGDRAEELAGARPRATLVREAALIAAVIAAGLALAATSGLRRRGAAFGWAVAAAAAGVGVGLAVHRSSEELASGSPLGAAALAVAPDVLLVLAEGALGEGDEDGGDALESLPASRRRSTDVASILTGVDPLVHGALLEGDAPSSPTIPRHLQAYGYEVGVSPGVDEEAWVGQVGRRLEGGLEGALAWLVSGGERPRFALVTGVDARRGVAAVDGLRARSGDRALVGSVVGMDRAGRHRFVTRWGPMGRADFDGAGVLGASEIAGRLFRGWGLVQPSEIEQASRRREEISRGLDGGGAVCFTPGAQGEVHLLEVATAAGVLTVELTRLGDDPLMDWELGGALRDHFVHRNRVRWDGVEGRRRAAEDLLERWHGAVALPARAARAGKRAGDL